MSFYSLHRDEQPFRDLFVAVSFGDQRQYFQLPLGEQFKQVLCSGGFVLLDKLTHQRGCHLGMNIGASLIDRADGEQQLLVRSAFQNITGCPVLQDMEQIFFVIVHGQDQNFGIGIIFFDFTCGDQSAFSRGHAKIHDQDIRSPFRYHSICLYTVCRSPYDFDIVLKIQNHGKPAAHHGVVVCDNDLHPGIIPFHFRRQQELE
ncbi:hypothetical protein D3C75_643220 [compost metagenome]